MKWGKAAWKFMADDEPFEVDLLLPLLPLLPKLQSLVIKGYNNNAIAKRRFQANVLPVEETGTNTLRSLRRLTFSNCNSAMIVFRDLLPLFSIETVVFDKCWLEGYHDFAHRPGPRLHSAGVQELVVGTMSVDRDDAAALDRVLAPGGLRALALASWYVWEFWWAAEYFKADFAQGRR